MWIISPVAMRKCGFEGRACSPGPPCRVSPALPRGRAESDPWKSLKGVSTSPQKLIAFYLNENPARAIARKDPKTMGKWNLRITPMIEFGFWLT